MARNEIKMHLPTIDDLFTTQEERDSANLEKIIDIDIADIDDFPNHSFKVLENQELQQLKDSIKENGILLPVLVREKADGRYEMLSGHRRKFASQLLGLKTIPCIIKNLTNEEATIIMVDSNLQREKILPSERAFAYKMKLEAIKHQGKRTDLTSLHNTEKLSSATIVGEEFGDSEYKVFRYIRLTNLIPELLTMVDNDALEIAPSIAMTPAVEISYLTVEEQGHLLDYIEYNEITPSVSQAKKLKDISKTKGLSVDDIEEILAEEKPNQIAKIAFNEDRIRRVLPRNIEEEKIEDFVVKSIEFYSKYLKQKEMNVR